MNEQKNKIPCCGKYAALVLTKFEKERFKITNDYIDLCRSLNDELDHISYEYKELESLCNQLYPDDRYDINNFNKDFVLRKSLNISLIKQILTSLNKQIKKRSPLILKTLEKLDKKIKKKNNKNEKTKK